MGPQQEEEKMQHKFFINPGRNERSEKRVRSCLRLFQLTYEYNNI
jgi:hypothetical protein